MPTKPVESILYRELSVAAAKDVIEIASPLLGEVVNYGANAFARCASSCSNGEKHLSLLVLHLHIIEMTDAIDILISQSCPWGAKLALRSSFEALLSVEYILEADYEQRSRCWFVHYMHERLRAYDSLDPSTPRGKEVQEPLSRDKYSISLPDLPELQAFRANYQQRLAEPEYQPVELEYRKRKHPRWYQLFGGPGNLRDLACRLNRGGQYETLYRRWSSITHAMEPARFLATTDTGTQVVRRLRDPTDIRSVTIFAVEYVVTATGLLISKLAPGEKSDFLRWYRTEVGPLYSRL